MPAVAGPLKVIRAVDNLEIKPTDTTVHATNGTPIRVVGVTTIPLKMDGFTTDAEVSVSEDVEEVMLGIDWLSLHRYVWDFGRKELTVDEHPVKLFSEEQPTLCRRVCAEGDVILPPRHHVDVVSRATVTDRRDLSSSLAVEARPLRPEVHVARTMRPNLLHGVKVRMMNTTKEPKLLRAGTYLGVADPVEIVLEDAELRENAVIGSSELCAPSAAPSSELCSALRSPSSALSSATSSHPSSVPSSPSSSELRAPSSVIDAAPSSMLQVPCLISL